MRRSTRRDVWEFATSVFFFFLNLTLLLGWEEFLYWANGAFCWSHRWARRFSATCHETCSAPVRSFARVAALPDRLSAWISRVISCTRKVDPPVDYRWRIVATPSWVQPLRHQIPEYRKISSSSWLLWPSSLLSVESIIDNRKNALRFLQFQNKFNQFETRKIIWIFNSNLNTNDSYSILQEFCVKLSRTRFWGWKFYLTVFLSGRIGYNKFNNVFWTGTLEMLPLGKSCRSFLHLCIFWKIRVQISRTKVSVRSFLFCFLNVSETRITNDHRVFLICFLSNFIFL